MPNGTYGGVRGRKITVVKKYYVIFLLLDYMLSPDAAAPPRHEVVPNYYYDGNLHMVHHDAADANNSMF